MKQVLYLSYDGLTDPLGQSQILPYLKGLSAKGYTFHIISFKKPKAFEKRKALIDERCKEAGLKWHPLEYTKNPPVLSTVYDLIKMQQKAALLVRNEKINLVHVRSYLPALLALKLKKKFNLPFVFDKRGFWIEERIEGRIWNPKNPVLAAVIRYFKQKEKKFFLEASAVVSLTHAARTALLNGEVISTNPEQIQALKEKTYVIPCAADGEIFSYVSPEERRESKRKNGVPEDEPVFVYLGSIGTWYMLKEILETYGALKKKMPKLWFYLFTGGDRDTIKQMCSNLGLSTERIRIEFLNREELRQKLSMADFSINFMRPGYSRLATSPVKVGELLSMGVPFIVNSGIGDSEEQIRELKAGLVTKPRPDGSSFMTLQKESEILFKANRKEIAAIARGIFSLTKAVDSYENVYEYALKK